MANDTEYGARPVGSGSRPTDGAQEVSTVPIPNAEWRLEFEAPAGARHLSSGCGITVMGGPMRWWDREGRRWSEDMDGTRPYSSHAPCRTFKAFKRHLRKHAAELSACEVVFVNRFKDNDVWARLAGLQGIAQPQSVSGLSHTGVDRG